MPLEDQASMLADRTMRMKNDERGQVLVITALCIVALIGFIALSVDVGALFYAKRQMQAAADAAATAAAIEYVHSDYVNNLSTAKAAAITAGKNAATANDISFGSALAVTVTVNANASSPAAHKSPSRIPRRSTVHSSAFGRSRAQALSRSPREQWLELPA
jgi:Flp pilus assembly protein TadG